MFVLMFLLKGRLTQLILHCLFLRGCCAFSYAGAASSNVCLSDERVEMCLLMDVGSCLEILGGIQGRREGGGNTDLKVYNTAAQGRAFKTKNIFTQDNNYE